MQHHRVEHIGLWVHDLERMRRFYVDRLGGNSSALYVNERTGFKSYFISFREGARIELMIGRISPGVKPLQRRQGMGT